MAPRRLAHSAIWQIPRKLPRHAADYAAQCALLLADFVSSQAKSTLTNILVLSCRTGEFAFLIFRALLEMLPSKLDSFVFIISDPSRARIAQCQSYFNRRNFLNFRNLEFSVFDPEYDTECKFTSGNRFKPGPTAVLAESLLLDSLRLDVFSNRHGKLHEGLVQLNSCRQWEPDFEDDELFDRARVKLSFAPVKTPYYTGAHEPLNRILHELTQQQADTFCVPIGAADVILNISHLTRGKFLVIAIDDCMNFLQLPLDSLRSSLSSTVVVLGGSFLSHASSPNSALICFGKVPASAVSCFNRFVGTGTIPNFQSVLLKVDISTALWFLEHSHYDPQVFLFLQKSLLYSNAFIDLKSRLLVALLNVFERRFWTSIDCCSGIGHLLMDMQFWEQACTVWQSTIAENSNAQSAASYHLAVCYNKVGRFEDARRTIDTSLVQQPFNESFRQLKLELMMAN